MSLKNTLNNDELKRELGFFSATILVVANMIGTGIFTTSGFIMAELNNPYTMLICWLVGGIFALCGALCYGELGALFPKAGGEYVFLREAFGKGMGFLTGWISLIVGFSAPIAAASIAFATYFFQAFSLPSPQLDMTIGQIQVLNISPITLVAVGIIVLLSLIHFHSLFIGSKVQNGLTLFKIVFLLVFIVSGLWLGQGSTAHFGAEFKPGSIFQDSFAVSLVFVAFAYSGWNAAAYLGSEIKNPSKNIPLSLIIGTIIVLGFYLLLNLVFIYALPAKEMSGVLEIGTKSASSLFGSQISTYFSLAISLGLLSVLSAMIMSGPRIYYAMAKDQVFFQFFSQVNKKRRTPAHSIFLQAGIASIMVITTSFDGLLLYVGFTLSLFALLTVLGLFRIRMKYPELVSQYRTFGYPITPLLFILGNSWIIYFSIKSRPAASICGLLTMGLGMVVYMYFQKSKNKTQPSSLEKKKILLPFLVLGISMFSFILSPTKAYSHSTKGQISITKGLSVQAKYSTGEPMSYAQIKVYQPAESIPFQQGNLDKNGRFLFWPDKNGTWSVKITDGMGHQLLLSKKIENPDQLKIQNRNTKTKHSSLSLYSKALMGLAIIFGISGILFWWKGKKTSSSSKT